MAMLPSNIGPEKLPYGPFQHPFNLTEGMELDPEAFSPMTGRIRTASAKCPMCSSRNTSIMAGGSGMSSYRKRCKECNHRWQVNGSSGTVSPMPVVGVPSAANTPDGVDVVYDPQTRITTTYINGEAMWHQTDLEIAQSGLKTSGSGAVVSPHTPKPSTDKPHTFGNGERKLNLD